MSKNLKVVGTSVIAVLLASAATTALAAGQAIIVNDSSGSASAATGLQARLAAAGYDVTIASDTAAAGNLTSVAQVWDIRYNTALSGSDSTAYLSYLNNAGGLFLIGENSGFATRNNSLVSFISAAGGGDVTYGGTTITNEYVTDIFNGSALIAADSATGFYVPAAGTFASAGTGTYITTAGPGGTGNGSGIAFGAGSLANAPTGRLLSYLDVNSFEARFYDATPALRALVDRMIVFVSGGFQVDPDLPPIGPSAPAVIDSTQPSFNLDDPAASGSTIAFDGGTLDMTGGSDPAHIVSSDVSITDNGAFINTAGNSSAFTGTVSGAGGIVVSGQGTVALTGTNTFAGGTVVTDSSTVQISDGNALGTGGLVLMGGQLELQDNTTLTLPVTLMSGLNAIDTNEHQVTVDGVILGAGGFVKTGGGTLLLTGTNSYTGGTVIASGTLEGNASSITGDVVNGGSLVLNQAADGVFNGAVSGTGSFTKSGSGTLTLTGANSYTGGTEIASGTLAGSASSIVGDVANNNSLIFNQTADGVFGGAVSGTGNFTKTGGGRLNLTGTSSYSGNTIVENGRLSVNGSAANSTVVVQAGGSIGGNGTIGGLIVRNNATAAPGNSIGQFQVATTVLFESGSTYQVEANASGGSDRIVASGRATLQGGTVQVLAAAGNYQPQTNYQILTASGGVTGTFAATTSNLAFLLPTLSYGPNAVFLTLTRNDVRFADVARTANQRATAGAINASFAPTSSLYYAVVGQSAETARQAFDRLSGEIHPSALSAAAQHADEFRRALLERMAAPNNGRTTLWTEVVGSWKDIDSNGNAAAVSSNAYGFRTGLETSLGSVRVGIAGSYADENVRSSDRASRADFETITGAVYAGGHFGALGLRAGASYSDIDMKTRRTAAAGALSQSLNAKYDARAIQAFGEAGVSLPLGNGAVEPFGGINALWLKNDGFTEQGGSFALRGNAQTRERVWSTVGMKATVPVGDDLPVSVSFKAGWQHALTRRSVDTSFAFASGGPSFAVAGVPLARDAALVDASINWSLSTVFSLGVAYTGSIADQGQSHSARAVLAARF